MNVLVVMPLGEFGGGAERMLHTYFASRNKDQSITLHFLFFTPGRLVSSAEACGYSVRVLPAGRLRQVHRILAVHRQMEDILDELSIDAILVWMPKAAIYVSVPAKKKGIPVLMWRHDIPSHMSRLDRLSLRYCDPVSVACSSETARNALVHRVRIRNTVAIYPGVHPLTHDEAMVAKIRQRVTRGERGALIVGTVARLQPWKRIDFFLESVALVKRKVPSVKALVVGGESHGLSAGYGDQLQELGRKLLGEDVTFAGEQADIGDWLQAMDTFVLASQREPFGISLVEALTAGKPVIAFAGGGPREIINSSTVGYVLDPDATVQELASGIQSCLSHPNREWALQLNPLRAMKFSPEVMANAIDDWILTVLDSRKHGMLKA